MTGWTASTRAWPCPGHGKPFVDVHGHIEGNRRLVAERIEATLAALSPEPQTALEIAPTIYGEPIGFHNGNWLLTQTLCYLHHLELRGQARRETRRRHRTLASGLSRCLARANVDTDVSTLLPFRHAHR